jgi:hypothetical protein
MQSEITRDVYDGIGPDGIDVRVYQQHNTSLPSVTTILKTRDDDKSSLHDWQDRNDGEGDNAYHKHLFWYSRHIGTLGHWHALHELDSSLEWSPDEAQSEGELHKQHESEVCNDSPREVLYSVVKAQHGVESWGEFYDRYEPYKNGSYYRDELVAQAERDIEFFVDAQQRLWSKLGITQDEIIEVEKFLFNDEYEYAGQVDLVYRDQDDQVVVADLKSSSGCYDKHQMQGAAYGKAIECADDVPVDSVDRLEVHRAHPRSGEMAVHTSEHTDTHPVHTTKYWEDSFEELWRAFESLAVDFTYDSDQCQS